MIPDHGLPPAYPERAPWGTADRLRAWQEEALAAYFAQDEGAGPKDFLAAATPGAGKTAFALRLAADYAAVTEDPPFLALLRETASRWYGEDRACPAWGEPSGDDFLSSCLAEAECMRALLPPEAFAPWFERFLPALDRR